jgi:probable HAF family extracellular repeat protein
MADGSGSGSANAVSADGSTVVGSADNNSGRQNAFRWTSAGMQGLGTLKADGSGNSDARAVSADGSTVVGEAQNDRGEINAFRRTSAGMQGLGTLKADGSGRSSASAVSADGSTVVGSAATDSGSTRTFIYRAPRLPVVPGPGPGIMQDYENVLQSFSNLAKQTALAANQQQEAMGRLLEENCAVGTTGLNCLRVSGVVSNTNVDDGIGKRQQSQGVLTLGHGINDNLTLGASLSSGSSDVDESGVDGKTAYGGSLWATYSEHADARTGLQADLSLGAYAQDNALTRGEGLSNVERLSGSADMRTVAGRMGVGYGFVQGGDWLITPGVAIIQQQTTRNSYDENQGAITGSYKKDRTNASILDLGAAVQTSINGVSRINLAAGIKYDLHADSMMLDATTDVPGMEAFKLKSRLERNDLRPYIAANYSHDLSVGTLSAGIRVAKDAYADTPQADISVSYGLRF